MRVIIANLILFVSIINVLNYSAQANSCDPKIQAELGESGTLIFSMEVSDYFNKFIGSISVQDRDFLRKFKTQYSATDAKGLTQAEFIATKHQALRSIREAAKAAFGMRASPDSLNIWDGYELSHCSGSYEVPDDIPIFKGIRIPFKKRSCDETNRALASTDGSRPIQPPQPLFDNAYLTMQIQEPTTLLICRKLPQFKEPITLCITEDLVEKFDAPEMDEKYIYNQNRVAFEELKRRCSGEKDPRSSGEASSANRAPAIDQPAGGILSPTRDRVFSAIGSGSSSTYRSE